MKGPDTAEGIRCAVCGQALEEADFQGGRALQLLGRRYCTSCLERKVEADKEERQVTPFPHLPSPAPQEIAPLRSTERRTCRRFVPPLDVELVIKAPGLAGLFQGNLVRFWIDVSETGFRAVLSRKIHRGDTIEVLIRRRATHDAFRVSAAVVHRDPSGSYPGCFATGARFVDPPAPLRVFIRDVLGKVPAAPSGAGFRRETPPP